MCVSGMKMLNAVGDRRCGTLSDQISTDQIVYCGIEQLFYCRDGLYSHDQFRVIADCPVNESLTSSHTVQHHRILPCPCGFLIQFAAVVLSRLKFVSLDGQKFKTLQSRFLLF